MEEVKDCIIYVLKAKKGNLTTQWQVLPPYTAQSGQTTDPADRALNPYGSLILIMVIGDWCKVGARGSHRGTQSRAVSGRA